MFFLLPRGRRDRNMVAIRDKNSSGGPFRQEELVHPISALKREALGIPDRRGIDLAVVFAGLAKKDLKASEIMYRNRLFPHAIFELQQSVDKAVKAVGLLLSLAKPKREDLTQEAGHATVFGILVRRNERLGHLRRNLGLIAASEELIEGKELFMRLGLPGDIPESAEMEAKMMSEQAINEEINRLRSLKPRDLWRITLDLEPATSPNPAILKLLAEAEKQWRPFDRFQRTFEKRFATYMSDPETLRFVLNTYGKALPEVAPLAFLTVWHEKETRYPPMEISDYWDPDEYKGTAGLVRMFPRLRRHATRLVGGAAVGAAAASRL